VSITINGWYDITSVLRSSTPGTVVLDTEAIANVFGTPDGQH
jgi:hypothetical protein